MCKNLKTFTAPFDYFKNLPTLNISSRSSIRTLSLQPTCAVWRNVLLIEMFRPTHERARYVSRLFGSGATTAYTRVMGHSPTHIFFSLHRSTWGIARLVAWALWRWQSVSWRRLVSSCSASTVTLSPRRVWRRWRRCLKVQHAVRARWAASRITTRCARDWDSLFIFPLVVSTCVYMCFQRDLHIHQMWSITGLLISHAKSIGIVDYGAAL